MEHQTPAPRASIAATVPLPLPEVLRIANEYEQAGRLDDAKRLLDCILAAAPERRLDDALAAARRATALAPADPLCLHNQAVIHYHRLELDQALTSTSCRKAGPEDDSISLEISCIARSSRSNSTVGSGESSAYHRVRLRQPEASRDRRACFVQTSARLLNKLS